MRKRTSIPVGMLLLLLALGGFPGCVTGKAFKENATAMEKQTAATPDIFTKYGDIAAGGILAGHQTYVADQRGRLLSIAEQNCMVCASNTLVSCGGKIRTLSRSRTTDIIASMPNARYNETAQKIQEDLAVLIAPPAENALPEKPAIPRDAAGDADLLSKLQTFKTEADGAFNPNTSPVWGIYILERSSESLQKALLVDQSKRLKTYLSEALRVKELGGAVNKSIQASWDKDDVMKALDAVDQLAGLAAIAVAVQDTKQ